MILNDFQRQNWGFYGFFWRFRAVTQVYIIHKVVPRKYRYAIQIKKEFGICILTWHEHPNFQLNY